MLDLRGAGAQDRSCQENLEEALQPYGLTGDDIGDIFNVFMNVSWDEKGVITRKVPTAKKGDHIDMRAEMNILAGISACPADNIVNDFRPKALGVKIFE
jgi:uncharacterized protein YcgI (DUF1989 family)